MSAATGHPSPEREALLALLRPLVREIMLEQNETLEDLRADRGWTQEQLARQAGVCRWTVSKIEAGKCKATPSTVALLATALLLDHTRVARACRRGR